MTIYSTAIIQTPVSFRHVFTIFDKALADLVDLDILYKFGNSYITFVIPSKMLALREIYPFCKRSCI